MVFVAPYNDLKVVAGQGTIGIELSRQIDYADAVFICVGGGGLISGITGYLKPIWQKVEVVGSSPANSAAMIESIRCGRIVEIETKRTLSDGSIVPGSINFELCRSIVDRFETVSEEEIHDRLRAFIETHNLLIEGSAAVPVATLLRSGKEYQGKKITVSSKSLDYLTCGMGTLVPSCLRVTVQKK